MTSSTPMIVFISSLPGQRPPCGLRLWSGAAGPVLAGQAALLVELGCDADVRGVSPVSTERTEGPLTSTNNMAWPGVRRVNTDLLHFLSSAIASPS